MADDADENTESNGKGSKTKLIIIIAVVLVLAIGAAAFFFLSGDDSSDQAVDDVSTAAGAVINPNDPAIYLNLDPAFIVDFNVNGKQRYLQLDLTIQSRSADQITAVKIHMPLIRNSLVLLFSSQDFAELQTADGKQLLKADALDAINTILRQETGVEGVESVLFTNFVMQ